MKTAADQKNVSVYKVIKSFTPYLFKENKKVTFSIMLVTLLMMALMVGQTILTANLFTSVEMAVGRTCGEGVKAPYCPTSIKR